ncbi:hypothetical protein D3093_28325 (plasmid) [Azospirillum argentinense]|uniref:Uncharacterized protein n=1 Tax=Azospirillum argentinense TaxID=2970906 RepID=A0A4D8PUZ6_9PROT|nr:hypothetical protein D3093_28325 [Azospirillum argentinense]
MSAQSRHSPTITSISNHFLPKQSARHSPPTRRFSPRFFDTTPLHTAAPALCLETARKVALAIAKTTASARRTTPIDRFIKMPAFDILKSQTPCIP